MIPRRHPFAQQRYPPLDSALLPVTRSRLLSDHPGVIHGITHRVPGLGLADGNLGYGPPRDTADAWQMRRQWSSAIGVDPDRLVAAGQVHGADVLRVRRDHAGVGARPDSRRVGIADALITDEPGVALLSLHADCLPLLLVDPQRPPSPPSTPAGAAPSPTSPPPPLPRCPLSSAAVQISCSPSSVPPSAPAATRSAQTSSPPGRRGLAPPRPYP